MTHFTSTHLLPRENLVPRLEVWFDERLWCSFGRHLHEKLLGAIPRSPICFFSHLFWFYICFFWFSYVFVYFGVFLFSFCCSVSTIFLMLGYSVGWEPCGRFVLSFLFILLGICPGSAQHQTFFEGTSKHEFDGLRSLKASTSLETTWATMVKTSSNIKHEKTKSKTKRPKKTPSLAVLAKKTTRNPAFGGCSKRFNSSSRAGVLLPPRHVRSFFRLVHTDLRCLSSDESSREASKTLRCFWGR